MSILEEGQRWAAALEPNWYECEGGFKRGIVYCHTLRMAPATHENPHNRCLLFGGKASWNRCTKCPQNEGTTAMGTDVYPSLIRDACATKDYAYRLERSACRRCFQRMVCVGERLSSARRVRLVVLR